MLMTLSVKNFAIIDTIEIEFTSGLSVLTGETGAGKSLIIDSIGLLFGQRASSDMIRYGEDKATIEGVFSTTGTEIANILDSFGIEFEDQVIIKREIYASGKSVSRVNGNMVSLNQLQELAEHLGDIHSQFDTRGLIHPKNYLSFLEDEDSKELLISFQESHQTYLKALKQYQNLVQKNEDDGAKIEFLKYQIQELENAELTLEEEIDLQTQFKQLSNFEQMMQNMAEVTEYFSENAVLENIYQSLQALKRLNQFDAKYVEYAEKMEDMYYQLTDIFEDLSVDLKSKDFDQNDLDLVNDRLGLYSSLKRKYKKSTEELIQYLQDIKEEINQIENYDVLLQEYYQLVEKTYEKTYELGFELSKVRSKNAENLQKEVSQHLLDLELKQSKFDISVSTNDKKDCLEKNTFYPTGIDSVDFMVTFNKGEPLKPLAKVASGGEMSRFMLSLKTAMFRKVPVSTVIFDEIDTGVSGEIAYKIATKMKEIAKDRQVLCITHLPQVAATGDQHIYISKHTTLEGTITKTSILEYPQKIEEIAKMISKGEITPASRTLAAELLSK